MGTLMSGNKITTMSDKLFDLCEKQLLSIIDDASTSMLKVTGGTSQVVRESAILFKLILASDTKRQNDIELCLSLEKSINDMVINMQFFDELCQRIEHIMKIVILIKIESNKEGFLSNPEDSQDLFDDIRSIFSIRSEFEVMQNIFPEYGELEKTQMVELF